MYECSKQPENYICIHEYCSEHVLFSNPYLVRWKRTGTYTLHPCSQRNSDANYSRRQLTNSYNLEFLFINQCGSSQFVKWKRINAFDPEFMLKVHCCVQVFQSDENAPHCSTYIQLLFVILFLGKSYHIFGFESLVTKHNSCFHVLWWKWTSNNCDSESVSWLWPPFETCWWLCFIEAVMNNRDLHHCSSTNQAVHILNNWRV